MRINRAVGLIIFLLVAEVLFSEVLHAVSGAIVSTMQTVETASQTASVEMIKAQR